MLTAGLYAPATSVSTTKVIFVDKKPTSSGRDFERGTLVFVEPVVRDHAASDDDASPQHERRDARHLREARRVALTLHSATRR
jgi:hypothetical protein